MLGVVLWSDASDRKAVIWCEDQGDLAYVNASDDVLWTDDFFDAGDLVQFEVELSHSMRLANNPRLVIEKAGSALPDVLRQELSEMSKPQISAEIIPFVVPPKKAATIAQPPKMTRSSALSKSAPAG